jgi:hypothetical protein
VGAVVGGVEHDGVVGDPRVLDLAAGSRADHDPRAKPLPKRGILGIVLVLRLLLGIQVVEVAEELVELVVGRQVLVAVAEMVLAELAGRVALRLEHGGDRRVLRFDAQLRTRQADFREARAKHALAEDERRPPGRST